MKIKDFAIENIIVEFSIDDQGNYNNLKMIKADISRIRKIEELIEENIKWVR